MSALAAQWQSELLATKLFVPPLRSQFVERPRLLARLDQALTQHHNLIAIIAPAGFGKTSLVAEWVTAKDVPAQDAGDSSQTKFGRMKDEKNDSSSVHPSSFIFHPSFAWLSLDPADNDPVRFMTYLLAAHAPFNLGGQSRDDLIQTIRSPTAPPPEAFLITLLTALASATDSAQPRALVLDDYHVITNPRIHNALAYWIDHLPANLHVVLTTRADPPLPLARWRVRETLTELRADDLRFTHQEAAAFLTRMMGLSLTALDVAALEERTEGWIAGLQLAALSLRGRQDVSGFVRAFTGSHRYIIDYLVEEVLRRESEATTRFLHQTSILERLSGALCNAVSGETGGQQVLEMLDRSNLFLVPLDDARQWYRYHHLFADVLRARLTGTQSAAAVSELHRRASVWFGQNGLVAEAAPHALAAAEFEQAARLIQENADTFFKRGEYLTLHNWLNQLPPEVQRARPRLALLRAWTYTLTNDLNSAEASLQEVERAARAVGLAGDRAGLLGEVAVIRSGILINRRVSPDLALMRSLTQQALDGLPLENSRLRALVLFHLGLAAFARDQFQEAHHAWSEANRLALLAGDVYTAVLAESNEGDLYLGQGQLHEAERVFQRAVAMAKQSGHGQMPVTGIALVDLGIVAYEWNALRDATQYLDQAIQRGTQANNPRLLAQAYAAYVKVYLAENDPVRAQPFLDDAEKLAAQFELPTYSTGPLAASQARMYLAQGDQDRLREWLDAAGRYPGEELDYYREVEHLALAHVLIAQGELETAFPLLERLGQAAQAAGRVDSRIKILALTAVARHARGETAAALTTLREALALAEPEGYVRTFVDAGARMKLILADFQRGLDRPVAGSFDKTPTAQRLSAYAERLLAAFDQSTPLLSLESPIVSAVLKPVKALPSNSLLEPLTEREQQVLRLMAEGLANPEIAERLTVSVGTVKTHVNHLFRKLDATSRTQAVARARALGLLSA